MITKGQKISDRYQIIKNIGEGGMANVYLAQDLILDREVAVKVLRGDLATDDKFVRRFQREALSASSLSDPNIVEVYDVGEDDGNYYIVMEFVEGKHLKHLIKRRGKLTVHEVVDIALQITSGLSVAHDSYLIHRDIKPQNILILENGLIKITDFGIAIAMNATQLTQTNSVMGSVHYLPPEQAMGKNCTLQSDIYAIGIVLFELLAGELPFTGDNAVEIALKHLKQRVPEISTLVDNIPQSLENVLIRATSKNPKNRYADAREMHDDLMTCLSETRRNEKKVTLKFPETDYDETRVMKIVKPTDELPKEEEPSENVEEKEEKDIINEDVTEESEDLMSKKKKKKTSRDKKQNHIILILASVFTGLVLIITTLVMLFPKFISGDLIEIPDVTGMTTAEAIKELQSVGFVVSDNILETTSKTIESGLVAKTNPLSGVERKKGFEITLYTSTGNSELVIEDYSGKDYYEVKGSLEAKGLQVLLEEIEVDISDGDYKEDAIIDQSVEAGEELSSGDIITLYIAKFDAQYPNFLDEVYSLSEVEDFADEYGLKLTVIEEETADYKEGTIFYQSREAGTTVKSGVDLRVKIAVAPVVEETPEPEAVEPEVSDEVDEEEVSDDVTEDDDCGGLC